MLASRVWAAPSTPISYHRDIVPILQKHCQTCHRPGEAVPMTLTRYAEVRPWARAIKQAVSTQAMPPWFADPAVGHFSNDRRLGSADVAKLTAWVDQGAPEGDAKDSPPPVQFADGWAIGEPDVVFAMPETVAVPAKGTVDYTYLIVPTGFSEDKWVQFAEARPGDRAVVHHIIVFAREPGSKWLRKYPVNKAFIPSGDGGGNGEFITGFAPGSPPEALREGQGKLIKAGSDLVFQMHYTANGKAASDRSRIGLRFAKTTPTQRVMTLAAVNSKFVIPPGAEAHRVEGMATLHRETELIGLLPHMHLRGKSMEIRAAYPDGQVEKLLWVPRYDFNWQLWYQLPRGKRLPAGTRIEATGTFDNSANNRNNPDPRAEVRQGEQSWEEMMMGFFNIAFDAATDPAAILRAPKKAATEPSSGGND
ncbi:MAG: thiol-disulfide isomerase [Bryobacterales bacterium]|nr:thiol-disulfide isomerase [Bryobacterales bacterium]